MRSLVIMTVLTVALTGCLNQSEKLLSQATSMANQVIDALEQTAPPDNGPIEAADLGNGKNDVGHRDFSSAKKVLPRVFAGMEEDFYCGCAYTGKTIDLKSCGYEPRKNRKRAKRLEWEHVVPAWALGHQRQCWQRGGRKNCAANDAVFRMAEGDLNNLVPSVGEVNGDRSNLSYGAWTRNPEPMYGQCKTIVDFQGKRVQPREEVRGRAGRISLYMHERYGLRVSGQDRKLWCAWARTYPADDWELRRDERIIKLQGEGNPLVSNPAELERVCSG
ncbi:endonuclease [Crenobacter cavernae]|uniref:Endonuclease n=1 Tax=Crenobacter cavernae TaxID=2290923 RepID=A0ABY0FD00_9NEIS|nr:endonuclease [Crenobacter cavernae]RXZ42508.1 endonuclease [Crenobacter cavernae]